METIQYSKLLESILEEELLYLLKLIKFLYPKIIDKRISADIKSKIKVSTKKQGEVKKDILETRVKNVILRKKFHNKGINILKFRSKFRKTSKNYKNSRNISKPDDRCIARVWGNGKIVRKKNKFILGYQCSRHRHNSSKYCFQHLKHNPHQDISENPSIKTIVNYKKHSKSKHSNSLTPDLLN